jgi:antitoxin component of MazEF toxin-antitoxin module
VECRFLFTELPQAIHAKIQTFPDTDSGSSYEAESMGFHGVALPELLLKALILVWGKRPGQVVVAKRKILATNQIRRKAMTTVGQIAEQTAEQDEI